MEKVEVTSELIQKINQGDVASFRKLYDIFYAPLFAFARGFVEYEDAKDVIADVFLKLWKNKEALKPMHNFKGYLTKAVQNSCISILRKEEYVNTRQDQFAMFLDEAQNRDFELGQLKADVYARIASEVSKLPRQTKLVLEMAFLQGLKNSEIAQLLGVSEQTVKNQKTNALAKLRVAFQKRPLYILFLLLIDQN